MCTEKLMNLFIKLKILLNIHNTHIPIYLDFFFFTDMVQHLDNIANHN